MERKIFFLLLMVFFITISSCVSNPSIFNKSVIDFKDAKIAVLPFSDFKISEGNNSGELVRSIFESRLIVKGFNVVGIEKTSSVIDYAFLKKHEYPGNWIVETGEKIGTDYMIFGSVHDYSTFQNVTSFLYFFSWLEVTSTVGITARMVSCKTGEVVWSGSFTRSSFNYNDASTEAVNALIRSIKRKLKEVE